MRELVADDEVELPGVLAVVDEVGEQDHVSPRQELGREGVEEPRAVDHEDLGRILDPEPGRGRDLPLQDGVRVEVRLLREVRLEFLRRSWVPAELTESTAGPAPGIALVLDDVAALFAESMMDLRPWGYWMPDGAPYEGTTEIVELIESVIERNGQHPGALHLYIHLMEAVTPAKAEAAADRLLTLPAFKRYLSQKTARMVIGVFALALGLSRVVRSVSRSWVVSHFRSSSRCT